MKSKKTSSGFTVLELLIVTAILVVLTTIVLTTFLDFRKNQALTKDTETIVSVLNQARNQTISSKNSNVYGVHFASSTITLFTGSVYDPGDSNNQIVSLNPEDTVVSVTLTGGGSNVVFQRISGETTNNGSVVVSSTGTPRTKTVTIYKTGAVESE